MAAKAGPRRKTPSNQVRAQATTTEERAAGRVFGRMASHHTCQMEREVCVADSTSHLNVKRQPKSWYRYQGGEANAAQVYNRRPEEHLPKPAHKCLDMEME